MRTNRFHVLVALLLLTPLVGVGSALAVSLPERMSSQARDRAARLARSQPSRLQGREHRRDSLALRPLSSAKPAARPVVRNARAKQARTTAQNLLLNQSPITWSFFAAPQIPVGGAPYSVVAGDFNGDTKQDVAAIVNVTGGTSNAIAVVLGNGDGSFQQPMFTVLGPTYVDRIYTADLNGDGNDDVVIVYSGSVNGFLSNGDGTFGAQTPVASSIVNPAAVALSDVDGGGLIDVVVADELSGEIATFRGNGDGTFQAPSRTFVTATQLTGAAIADVNGDGKLDLVSRSQVFLADGAGGFLSPTSLVSPNPGAPFCGGFEGMVAVGNLNGNSMPEIVTADCASNTVTLYVNNGNGTFQAGTALAAGSNPTTVIIRDADGDGRNDIIAAGADLTILAGDGTGTFQTARTGYAFGGYLWVRPVVADFNGDGKADILVPEYMPDYDFSLTYLQNTGTGSFNAATDYYSPAPPAGEAAYGFDIASADFNGDGQPDFVLGNSGSASVGVTVFLAGSGGGLQPAVNYGTGGALNYVATGDFNGDGKQDIVASDAVTSEIALFLGNGSGTFQDEPGFPAASSGGAYGMVVGDFNGDHKPDIAVLGSPASVIVLLNSSTGGAAGFEGPASYAINGEGWGIASADLNRDGTLDLVVTQGNSAFVSILLGQGDGTFVSAPDFALPLAYPDGVAVGDLDGDGNPDIAVAIDDDAEMGIAVALGNGDGSFQDGILYPSASTLGSIQPYPGAVRMVDINQDGKLDLVYTNSWYGTVGVMLGAGDGTFFAPVESRAFGSPYLFTLADVNGDGATDAVLADTDFSGVTVLLAIGGSRTTIVSSVNPASSDEPVTFTATVTSRVSGVTLIPSGTVTFMDGSTALGTGTLSAGQVLLVVPNLSAGAHSISAAYSGDTVFVPSSATLTQTVTATAPGSYSLTATPTSAIVTPLAPASFTVTVNPIGGYSGTVTFACGTMPGVTCQFNPTSVTPVGGLPASTVLTVSVAPIVGMLESPAQPRPGQRLPLWASFAGCLFGLVGIDGLAPRRRRQMMAMVAVVLLIAVIALAGCGGTSTPTSSPLPAGAHTIQVVATGAAGTGAGTSTQQLSITVTIQR
jgi:hypothetical protein